MCTHRLQDTEAFLVLECEVEFNEEGMGEETQNLLFSAHLLHLLLLDDVTLVQNFHCVCVCARTP